jgi:hypothetical protein
MSLNDFPVSPEVISKIHFHLRERLNAEPSLKKVPESISQVKGEYWVASDWIYVVIENLHYPTYRNNYNIQVMCGIPEKVWRPEYEKIKQELSHNLIVEQMLSRKASEYSFLKGVFHRDNDIKSIKREALKLKMEIMTHVKKLQAMEGVVVDDFCKVLNEALKL